MSLKTKFKIKFLLPFTGSRRVLEKMPDLLEITTSLDFNDVLMFDLLVIYLWQIILNKRIRLSKYSMPLLLNIQIIYQQKSTECLQKLHFGTMQELIHIVNAWLIEDF